MTGLIIARMRTRVVEGRELSMAGTLFPDTMDSALREIVQNSRRAGSTSIRISLTRRTGGSMDLTVEDDGRGLAMSDAGLLITLGGSKATDEVRASEMPAGMGCHSLSGLAVAFSSRAEGMTGWTLEVPRGTLAEGGTAILSTDVDAPERGMKVTLRDVGSNPAFGKMTDVKCAMLAIAATRHSGMKCVLRGFGNRDGAYEPEPFLSPGREEASHATRRMRGLTARVARSMAEGTTVLANFKGAEVSLPTGEDFAITVDASHVKTGWDIRIDIDDAGSLGLRPPGRDMVIEDGKWMEVKRMIREAQIRLLAGEGEVIDRVAFQNGVPRDSPIRDEARAMGIEMPGPSIVIDGPTQGVSTADGRIELDTGELLEPSMAVAFPLGMNLAGLQRLRTDGGRRDIGGLVILDAEGLERAFGRDAGYRTIGAMATLVLRVGEARHTIVIGSDLSSAEGAFGDRPESDVEKFRAIARKPVDEITVAFLTDDGRSLDYGLEAIWAMTIESSDPILCCTRGAKRSKTVGAMLHGIDWYDDGGDTWDTQAERAEASYAKAFDRLMSDRMEAAEDALRLRIRGFEHEVQLPEGTDEISFIVTAKRGEDGRLVARVTNTGARA